MTSTAVGTASLFQSTHPVRGATDERYIDSEHVEISIHAPREGCDSKFRLHFCFVLYFNPRTP